MTDKKKGRIVGALYLTVMITFIIGMALISPMLNSSDVLKDFYPNRVKVIIGIMFELIEMVAVIGIVALMFTYIKKWNESLAIGYMIFRIIETIMLVTGAAAVLSMVVLSQEFLKTASPEISQFDTLRTLLISMREGTNMHILALFYGLAGVIFYSFMYRSKLIPRYISIWGFIAASLVFAGAPLEMYGVEKGTLISNMISIPGIAMGLNEFYMGGWLLVKGFNAVK